MAAKATAANLVDTEPEVAIEQLPPKPHLEQVPEPEKPTGPPSLYAEGTELFTFNPSSGDVIELPLKFPSPSKRFLFDQYQRNFLAQTWEWMKLACVPMEIQRRVADLDDEEYGKLFEEWFSAVAGGTKPGE